MTSLFELIVLCPRSLAYWPSGLEGHPSLKILHIKGSNQIPPEELVAVVVTGLDHCSWNALSILIDDVYSRRKDNLRIAEALMANSEKLHLLMANSEKMRSLMPCLLSQLLYALWVEADCTLHECTAACAEMNGPLIQDCLRGLLSSKTFISLLLRTPNWHVDWQHDTQSGETITMGGISRSKYAYESLVLVCCASIQKFEVVLDEEEYEHVGDMVDSFTEYVECCLFLLKDQKFRRTAYGQFYEPLVATPSTVYRAYQHNLSAARVADAVCKMKRILLKRGPEPALPVSLDAVKRILLKRGSESALTVGDEFFKKWYTTLYQSRPAWPACISELDNHSTPHELVGCFCRR